MRVLSYFFIPVFLILTEQLFSQYTKHQEDFSSPLNIPLYLSGNFGEIRSTHIHSGLDIKTQQQTGKEVFASKEGYVSRIKVQSGGYGNSLYILHPDGYTTVYAHLNDVLPEIAAYIKNMQYAQRKFEIDVFPEKYRFSVSRGQLIAHSGNTGNSGGPHLHFEIRDAYQEPLNGLKFHFEIQDNIAPVIYNLVVYPVGDKSLINGKNKKLFITPVRTNGKYRLPDSVIISGNAGFGIETYDYLNGSGNRCTVYSIKLSVNDTVYYYHEMDKFAFSEVKYLNSHIDYEAKVIGNLTIHRLFLDPNNHLSIYKIIKDKGMISFKRDSVYNINIEVKDAYMNSAELNFVVKGAEIENSIWQKPADSSYIKVFHYDQINTYQTPEIRLMLPEYSLYRDIPFKYSSVKTDSLPYSDLHFVHADLTPLCSSYNISIRTRNLPPNLTKKAFIAMVDRENKIYSYGGTWQKGFITATADCFGKFFIMLDTIAPDIKPVNFRTNGHYAADDRISFEIQDDLTGIKSYNGYIDNEWALFEYDRKTNTLLYKIDKERLIKGKKHSLELVVVDDRDNISVYKSGFYY